MLKFTEKGIEGRNDVIELTEDDIATIAEIIDDAVGMPIIQKTSGRWIKNDETYDRGYRIITKFRR